MTENTICETENLQFLAGFDFLDVCLLGETGTGKTHLAQRIHDLSSRKDKPFVAVNCAELPAALIESELFGYEKGAFTGATEPRRGKFEAAGGGTIFLDEIGELALEVQAKLLKVVEEKRVTRVGSSVPRPLDVRIIYATNRDLSVLRQDLRYRVRAAHTIELKPLRERPQEISRLAKTFIADFNRKCIREVAASETSLRLLTRAEWRGNVRELRFFVEKACLAALFSKGTPNACHKENSPVELTGEIILAQLKKFREIDENSDYRQLQNFSEPSQPKIETALHLVAGAGGYKQTVEQFDRDLIEKTLEATNQNVSRAAVKLELSRYGLIKKIRRYGIKVAG